MSVDPSVIQIEAQFFTPALQKAMQESTEAGYNFNSSLLGAANAYINMLVELVGKDQAIQMIKDQTAFLESQ